MLPRISIITPSYQQAPFLGTCLRSIHDQGYPDLEHIVVDGGSTDGSAAIIEAHADRLAWWCSERDEGQSDALNKGLARATGTVLGWVNSDDLLLPGALQRAGEVFAADPRLLVYGGQRVIRDADGKERLHPLDDPRDPERLFVAPVINQQSTFFRLEAVREAGGVDPVLHHVMDHELWLRLLFRHGTDAIRLEPVPLAVFRMHGAMKSMRARTSFADELAGVLHGLCVQCGLKELAAVLAMGHRWPAGIRTIPVGAAQRDRVRCMTVYFLLKWGRRIFTREQFAMMRRFRDIVATAPTALDEEQRGWLGTLDRQLAVPGWWAFRVRRKWRHLFP